MSSEGSATASFEGSSLTTTTFYHWSCSTRQSLDDVWFCLNNRTLWALHLYSHGASIKGHTVVLFDGLDCISGSAVDEVSNSHRFALCVIVDGGLLQGSELCEQFLDILVRYTEVKICDLHLGGSCLYLSRRFIEGCRLVEGPDKVVSCPGTPVTTYLTASSGGLPTLSLETFLNTINLSILHILSFLYTTRLFLNYLSLLLLFLNFLSILLLFLKFLLIVYFLSLFLWSFLDDLGTSLTIRLDLVGLDVVS